MFKAIDKCSKSAGYPNIIWISRFTFNKPYQNENIHYRFPVFYVDFMHIKCLNKRYHKNTQDKGYNEGHKKENI